MFTSTFQKQTSNFNIIATLIIYVLEWEQVVLKRKEPSDILENMEEFSPVT